VSDLQCPVTVVFCDPGCLGSARVRQLFAERAPSVAFVCSQNALDAEMLAMAGARAWPISALADVADADTLREAVELLSDLHRGETIVVVAPTDLIQCTVTSPRLPPVVVAIDSDGWVMIE
jgi:hypothetical protein